LILLGAFRKGGSCRQAPRKSGAKSAMQPETHGRRPSFGSATIDRPCPGGARQKTPWTVLTFAEEGGLFSSISNG
jgi:hypothetical protein